MGEGKAMSTAEKEQEQLFDLLLEHSFEKRDVTLASGEKSNFYIDCKQTALKGEGATLLGRRFYDALCRLERDRDAPFDCCAGVALGGVPLCTALTQTAHLQGRALPALVVRKEQKSHGTSAWVEGARGVAENASVVMVEDVVTTGGSTIDACKRLREAGFTVDTVLAIIERGAHARKNLAEAGLNLHALMDATPFEERARGTP
jgi:orotate phosphoribosyltransferase